jgi:hypothetical protein
MPTIISDARKADQPREEIQKTIIQGVLKTEGLPPLADVVRGDVGMSKFPLGGGKGGKEHPAVLPIASGDIPKTHQKLGSMRYTASQKR